MDNVARLVLPASAQPKFKCEVCGEGFYTIRPFTAHVSGCVKRNDDSIAALHHQHKNRDPLEHITDHEAIDFQRRKFGHLY